MIAAAHGGRSRTSGRRWWAAACVAAALAVPRVAAALPMPPVGTGIGKVIVCTNNLSQFPAAFIASHFNVGISVPESLMKRIKATSPTFCALAYLNANVDPNFPAYNTLTLIETRWMHTSDPASLHAITSNGRIDLYWMADRRPQLANCSYAVYRQRAGEATATRIAITAAGATSYSDLGVAAGQSATYYLTARTAAGVEYSFSEPQVFAASPAGVPGWGPLTLAQTVATDSTTCTITVEGENGLQDPVVLFDRNQDRVFDQTAERFDLQAVGSGGGGRTLYSVTVRAATHKLSGYSWLVQDMGVTGAYPLPAAGALTTNVNNRVRDKAYGAMGADMTDPSVTGPLADSCVALVARGYDGIFADAVVAYLTWLDLDGVPLGVDDVAYRASELALLQAYRAALGPSKALVYNGLSTLSMDFLSAADGSAEEGVFLARWFPNGYVPTPGWTDAISHTIQAVQIQHRAVLDLIEVHEDDIPGRIYGLASYLMCKGDFHYLALNWSETTTVYLPEMDLLVGQPIETYLDVTQYRHGSGIYGRRFERALVLINPGEATITEALPTTMYRVDPDGGVVPELGGDGQLLYTPVSSVTLGPYSAAILLDSTVDQP